MFLREMLIIIIIIIIIVVRCCIGSRRNLVPLTFQAYIDKSYRIQTSIILVLESSTTHTHYENKRALDSLAIISSKESCFGSDGKTQPEKGECR